MEILLANNVNIDQEVPQLGTPLYVACTHQRVDCVKKLLELGNFQKSCHKNLLILLVFHGFKDEVPVRPNKILTAFDVSMRKTTSPEKRVSVFFRSASFDTGSIYLAWGSLVVSRESKSLSHKS